jgi:predicted regulator of Ras-like GTPase activity (Roadblock/LC7/MglB family)
VYFENDSAQGFGTGVAVKSGSEQGAATVKTPQVTIEKKMAEIISLGAYEAAHLFSDEGLPIAQASSESGQTVDRDRLAELAILFQDVRRMASLMGGISRLREVLIEGENHRKIVFRFFRAFEQQVILAVVVPPKKSYRQRTNELEKLIVGESF